MPSSIRVAALVAALPVLAFAQAKPASTGTVSSSAGPIRDRAARLARIPLGRCGVARWPPAHHRKARPACASSPTGKLSAPVEGVPKTSLPRAQTGTRRPARRGRGSEFRAEPPHLSVVFGAGRQSRSPDQKETERPAIWRLPRPHRHHAGGRRGRAAPRSTAIASPTCRSSGVRSRRQIGRGHFGHRIAFGEGRHAVRHLGRSHAIRSGTGSSMANLGKVVRINADGSIPKDNPHAGKDIWSVGHRNMLAAAVHPGSGQLWVRRDGTARRRRAQPDPAAARTTAGRS